MIFIGFIFLFFFKWEIAKIYFIQSLVYLSLELHLLKCLKFKYLDSVRRIIFET